MANLKSLVFIIVVTVLSFRASADTATACPETAEQKLFDTLRAIQSGQKVDVTMSFQIALAGLEKCPDRSEVQGLAVEIFSTIAVSGLDSKNRLHVFSKAYQAAVNNAAAYRYGNTVKVTLADGSPYELFTYGQVSLRLRDTILPGLVKLAEDGFPHDMFSAAPLDACPYSHTSHTRVREEGEALGKAIKIYRDPVLTQVTGRLERLREACPNEKASLSLTLADIYERGAGEMLNTKDERRGYADRGLTNIQAFIGIDYDDRAGLDPYYQSGLQRGRLQALVKALKD